MSCALQWDFGVQPPYTQDDQTQLQGVPQVHVLSAPFVGLELCVTQTLPSYSGIHGNRCAAHVDWCYKSLAFFSFDTSREVTGRKRIRNGYVNRRRAATPEKGSVSAQREIPIVLCSQYVLRTCKKDRIA